MKICQQCGYQNRDDAYVCGGCGQPFSQSHAQPHQQPNYQQYQNSQQPPYQQQQYQQPQPQQPAFPPKRKRMHGCLIAFLVVLGLLVSIVVLALVFGDPAEKPVETTVSGNTEITTAELDETETATHITTEAEKTKYKAGTYKVGTDLPAGEYLVIDNTSMGYLEITENSNGTFDSIIANAVFYNRSYVTVEDGQYLKFSGTAYPADEVEPYEPKNGVYESGQYLVGRDIPAGEYKIILQGGASGMGYLEVTKDSSHQFESIISNEAIQGDTYQTVEEGQYLLLQSCEIHIQP